MARFHEFNQGGKAILIEKITFEQCLKVREQTVWLSGGIAFQAKKNSQSQEPKAEERVICWRKSKEASVAVGKVIGQGGREITG